MNAHFDVTWITIETDRLLLRPFEKTDLRDFYAYAKEDGVGQAAGWKPHESIEESEGILQMFIDEKKTFALVDKASGRVIGSLGIEKYGMEDKLTEFDGLWGRELGFVLAKEYWGKGLMPEAVSAVIAYCFDVLDYDFLICGYYDFNRRSARVQEKVGFRPYRHLTLDTRMGTKEDGTLNLLCNPKKDLHLQFSHPETLTWRE